MALEFIFNAAKISKNPHIIFFETLVLSFMSAMLAIFIFPKEFVSIGILAFITIGMVPVFAKLFSYSSYLYNYSDSFFVRHKTLFLQISYFFLGVFVSFIVLFFVLGGVTKEKVFSTQFQEIKGVENVRATITGQVSQTSISSNDTFSKVFFLVLNNNLGVVLRAAVLSFFYGAGALFLIAWNASILATVIANDIFMNAGLVLSSPLGIFNAIFQSIINFVGYLPHGFPEMLAYFVISFAGAMFARALVKGLFTTEFRWKVLGDILFMLVLSLLLVVVGAIIEASYFL